MSVGRNSLLGSYRLGSLIHFRWLNYLVINRFPMFAKNVLKPFAISCLLFVSLFPITNSSFCLLWFGCLFSTSRSICHVRLGYTTHLGYRAYDSFRAVSSNPPLRDTCLLYSWTH